MRIFLLKFSPLDEDFCLEIVIPWMKIFVLKFLPLGWGFSFWNFHLGGTGRPKAPLCGDRQYLTGGYIGQSTSRKFKRWKIFQKNVTSFLNDLICHMYILDSIFHNWIAERDVLNGLDNQQPGNFKSKSYQNLNLCHRMIMMMPVSKVFEIVIQNLT